MEAYLTRHLEHLSVVCRTLDSVVGCDEVAGDCAFFSALEKQILDESRLLVDLMRDAGLRTRPSTGSAGRDDTKEMAPPTLDELEELALACRRREMMWSTLGALSFDPPLKCPVPFVDLERKAQLEAETLEDKLFLVARATLGAPAGVC